MSFREVFVDWRLNSGELRAQLILVGFRLTRILRLSTAAPLRFVGRFVAVFYRLFSQWLLGVELPWMTVVGPRLRLFHPHGIVINAGTRIGSDVVLRQNVTLGGRRSGDDCPVICDRADIGAGAGIIGAIRIGIGAKVGLGAVVLVDVPDFASAFGNPAMVRVRPGEAA